MTGDPTYTREAAGAAHIITAVNDGQLAVVRRLWRRYAASLDFDLEFQGFSQELANLPGDYARPAGCILLARREKNFVGCTALRPLGGEVCEMKRLFVLPGHRKMGIGRALAAAVIEKARRIGYKKMRLDTLASMQAANALYASLGFHKIEAYRYNPLDEACFLELGL